MKRLLSICLFTAIIIGSFSFTTNSEIPLSQKRIIHVAVVINQPHDIYGTNCVATVNISLAFDYNTDNGSISNVNVNTPTVTVTCGSEVSRVVNASISTLSFNTSAHVTTLEFSKIEDDEEVDGVLSDPDVISDLKAELNSEIDKQIN